MSSSEEHRFDSILLALAEQHKNGVPEVIAQFDLKNSVELSRIFVDYIFSCLALWPDFWHEKQIFLSVEKVANGKP